MKKLFILALSVLLSLTLCLTTFATGAFITSPSTTGAPGLVGAENENGEDCESFLQISSFADRGSLPDDIREVFEYAYDIIKNTEDMTTLTESLAQLVEEKGYAAVDLAVSDFFDISITGDGSHGHINITLKADALKNFVCLLHYYGGEWHVVEDAKVTENGTHLEFTEDEFSPFAIVVHTGETSTDPSGLTVGQSILLAVGIIAGVGGLGALTWFVILPAIKKSKGGV